MADKKPAAQTGKQAATKPKAKAPTKRAPKPEGPTATSHAGPTGICRQCNKPADHKHIGV